MGSRTEMMVGSRLGPYEIVAPIGAGAMGVVYRARDINLQRDVAVKILPPQLASNPENLERFRREARLSASLNHPRIAAIYGLEVLSPDGLVCALVMELLDGSTLASRLGSGRVPLMDALRIAGEIAEGLEAAHQKDVVHRDLKPANVFITADGSVKILDFGLAKTVIGPSASPELAETGIGETRQGAVLGSPGYMSPEQLRGHPVDKRTDVWAFGCVLFEMLAGTRAFTGTTMGEAFEATLTSEPDWTRLSSDVPPAVRRLMSRCLEKDPRRRLHDIADARIELEDAIAAPVERRPAIGRWGTPAAALAAIVVAAGVLAFLVWPRTGTVAPPPAVDLQIARLTDLPGLEESPAISPDGRSVAFAAGVNGKRQLFLQLVAGGAPLQLTSDPIDHEFPRWSPDSSSIFYFSPPALGSPEGNIWLIPALGGAPRRVVGSMGGADVNLADGRLAFFRLRPDGMQLVVSAADGSSVGVLGRFPATTYYLYPRWSPDGRWIAYQRGDSIRFDVFVVPSSGGEPRQLTRDNAMIGGFAWLPDSSGIIYSSSRGGTMPYLPTLGLWTASLNDESVRRVTSGEMSYVNVDVGKNGTVLASRMRLESDIWRFPADGSPAENVARAVRVTNQTGQVLTPTAGPGDKEVAFLSDSGGHANLVVVNTESRALRSITNEVDPNVAVGVPVWSPDGRSIAFVSSRGNQGLTFGVWLIDSDGSNMRNIANPGLGPAWSADGKWVYYTTRGGPSAADIVVKKIPADASGPAITVTSERPRNVIGMDGKTLYYLLERPLVDGIPEFEIRAATPETAPFRVLARVPSSRVPIWQIVNPALSPDGRWMAQALTDGLTTNIWALSTATGEWRQVTDFGNRPTFIARRVSWSSDGQSIFAAVGEGDSDIVRLEGLLPAVRQ